jgi:sigma-B regulation protein RsbU (phosphoserine phosphatase)
MNLAAHSIDSSPFKALVADDQPDVLEAIRVLLKRDGCSIVTATSPDGILGALGSGTFDVLLMDLNYARDTTSGREGLGVLGQIRALDPTLPIVAMTAWSTVDLAVESMRLGVGDFVQKPWHNDRLMEILRHQVQRGQALRADRLREEARRRRERERASRLRLQEREISEAREVQIAQLSRALPRLEGFQISGTWRPARGVSGDLFDVFPVGDGSIGLCIADVAGKGVPAALMMSGVHAAVEAVAGEGAEPRAVCHKVNRILCRHLTAARYVTCFYARLDPRSRRLVCTNAGHNPPLLVHVDGTCRRLTEGGGVLGAMRDWCYEQQEIQLQRGDRLVLFTDGLTEAMNDAGAEFGEGRIVDLVRAHRTLGAAAIESRVIEAVSRFTGGALQDDATLLVLAVHEGAPPDAP